MRKVGFVILLSCIGVACDEDDGGPEDLGEDTFESSSLAAYEEESDDGAVGFWFIDNGAVVARGEGDAYHTRLIRRNVELLDGRVEIDTDHISNGLIVFRYQNSGTFYYLAVRDDDTPYFNMTRRNLELYRVLDSQHLSLAEVNLDFERGADRSIGVEFVGSSIALLVGGAVVAEIANDDIAASGRIGIGHDDQLIPGEQSYFDALRWRAVGR